MTDKHTFVVCAYKQSQYLEECVQSLINQRVKSKILISTSTPNQHIQNIADRYSLPVYVNRGEHGITGDWNFAYSLADSEYVTLAHQDDYYEENYTERVLSRIQGHNPIIIFSEYYEIRNGEKVSRNLNLKIKHFMNLGFRLFGGSRFIRRRVLSLGNPICCPAVTYSVKNCNDFHFDRNFKVSCDWEAWSRLAEYKGEFLYLPDLLVGHRIHAGSETTATIENHDRYREDLIMYRRYWPEPIAQLFMRQYAKSMNSNILD